MPAQIDVGAIAQFGFAAVVAITLLTNYLHLIPKLLDTIGQNSQALEKIASALAGNTKSLDELRGATDDIKERIIHLEDWRRRERL